MKITPKTEEQLNESRLLPDGEYPFTVLDSDEIPSKSEKNRGKMMFALKLNVHGPSGDVHVYDYFSDWFSEWKLRHFAETTGLLANYNAGELDGRLGAFTDRTGFVSIKTEPAGRYPAKNVVADYVVKSAADVPQQGPTDGSDDVPF